ncbi:MAG: hypothetical protein WKF84_27305 [Pyrinomonadaceae bacterium]
MGDVLRRHPLETAAQLKAALGEKYAGFARADALRRSELLGELSGEVVAGMIGGKGVGAITKTAAKAARTTRIGAAVREKTAPLTTQVRKAAREYNWAALVRVAVVLDDVIRRGDMGGMSGFGGMQPAFAGAGRATGRRSLAEMLRQPMRMADKDGKPLTAADLKPVPTHELINAMQASFKARNYQFGNHTFKLDWAGMKHILQRHHPEFWDGTVKNKQSFFAMKTSMEEVKNAISAVLKQNREVLIQRGTNSIHRVRGTYNGQEYVLGIDKGRIGQFYSKEL